jgi:hypothetical protein
MFAPLRPVGSPGLSAALAAVLMSAPLVHEVAHAVAAWLVGARVVRLDLGPLSLRHGQLGWRARRSAGLGAWAAHITHDSSEGLRRREVATLAAGPAAVVTLGAAYAAAAQGAAGGLRSVLWLAALVAFGDGVVNMVPFGWRSARTDGWKLLTWFARPGVMRLRAATSNLLLAAGQGIRPALWPADWVAIAAQAPAGADLARHATARYLAYLAARDAGRADEAWQYLAQSLGRLDRLTERQGGALLAEAALHHAWSFRDPVAARALLERVPRLAGLQVHRLRALGAIELAEGGYAAAVVACDRVLAAADSVDQAGISVALKDWVRMVRAEALGQLIAADAPADGERVGEPEPRDG